MAEHVRVLIPEDQIEARITEIADQISEAYKGESLHLICILKGGAMFMCELAKRIHDVDVSFDFMSVSSYGGGTTSSGIVKIVKDLDEPLEGKHVMIVEDIIDTGHTLNHLSKMLLDRKPLSIEICTLLNKPSRREKEVPVKYSCFEIPDEFVVGYGLDYDEKYRNLPYVGILKPEVYEK